MGAAYTLHLPRDAAHGDPEALERAALVRDGFSWGAFLVPMLWFFRHRHWLLGLGALAVVAGSVVGLWLVGAGLGTIVVFEVLLHALLGLEGPSLRRWAYGLRGRPIATVVVAANESEAETKSFARWLPEPGTAASGPEPRPGLRWPVGRREPDAVIGLFPDGEGRR